jgi:ribosome-associated toxin RatA of RatAB toxin-antitoxin module
MAKVGIHLVVTIAAWLLPATVVAGGVTTQVEREDSVLHVRSTLTAEASPANCYATIADLDHLADFVPGLRSSTIVSPPGMPIELRQVGEARAGPFGVTLDVTLAVRLEAPRQIEFRRIAGNLLQMEGSWTVTGSGQGCMVEYRAMMEPDFWVPPLIGPLLMRNKVDEQMAAVLAEIERREVQ